jgi:hypothetical protein
MNNGDKQPATGASLLRGADLDTMIRYHSPPSNREIIAAEYRPPGELQRHGHLTLQA